MKKVFLTCLSILLFTGCFAYAHPTHLQYNHRTEIVVYDYVYNEYDETWVRSNRYVDYVDCNRIPTILLNLERSGFYFSVDGLRECPDTLTYAVYHENVHYGNCFKFFSTWNLYHQGFHHSYKKAYFHNHYRFNRRHVYNTFKYRHKHHLQTHSHHTSKPKSYVKKHSKKKTTVHKNHSSSVHKKKKNTVRKHRPGNVHKKKYKKRSKKKYKKRSKKKSTRHHKPRRSHRRHNHHR